MANPQLLRLGEHLRHLKLFRVQKRLDTLLQEASAQELTYADFLDRLLTEEVTAKEEKHVTMRTVTKLVIISWVSVVFDTAGEVVQALVRCIGIVVISDRHSEVSHASPDADRPHSI
jgi:DNA replication protein DnaC